jgi:asparagine synthase (glutamine-hydrolysing)
MCGICGVVYSERLGRTVDPASLTRMRDVMSHRGPDEAGSFIDRNVGLGHRRLSIVDLANGQQPMSSADGACTITYNGEVYNHAEHRPHLEAKGYRYRTHCDTESIIYLYQEYGAECVQKLRGMFAFAIWDASRKELFLARDRLGVKPLYYVHDREGNLFFASEIKALLEAGAVEPELNYHALGDYLANHAPTGEQTLFAGVKRLLPGHTLTWKDGVIQIDQYWDLEFVPKHENAGRTVDSWVSEWRERFEEAVKLRLMADVPLGMFLSGGIDSSAIAAVMSKLVDEPIKTFSVAFAEREANELEYARLVADRFKTDHHEVIVSPREFFDALPDLIWHEDEPLAHPSSVALNFVSKLASHHVKVVLTGEGSDESLAGYGRYYKTLLNLKLGNAYQRALPAPVRSMLNGALATLPMGTRNRNRFDRSFLSLDPDIQSMYFDNFAVFPRSMQSDLLTERTRDLMGSSSDPYREMSAYFDLPETNSLLDRMLYADSKTYLHELLMKQDQMSMAASIESRVPFLDHDLMGFAARLPDELKLSGSNSKFILREAMKGVLPDEIISRSKMGFPVPFGKWLRGEASYLVNEYILSDLALSREIFNADSVRELVARHNRGENHDERLWALLNFEIWQRRFLDGAK